MGLRQLEYFHLASRLLNITKVAERLGVTQPNVTVTIKNLEKELGIQLFDRRRKQLFLTAEGEVFLSRIEPVLQEIQDAVQELYDYRQLEKWRLKIGISPMIGSYLVPRIVPAFQREYPNADIFLYEESSSNIREKLDSFEFDFGIDVLGCTTLSKLPLCKSPLMVCVSESNPIADASSVSLDDLCSSNIIMPREGAYIRELIQEQFMPHIVLETDQIITTNRLVGEDVGIAFLPDFMAKDASGVRALPFSNPVFLDIGLSWKGGSYSSKASQTFVDFCKKLQLSGKLFPSEDVVSVDEDTVRTINAKAEEKID